MSSTTAGARFGFALVGLILLTNLIKYPFLRVGTRFTAATGLSLLEGFQQRNPLYLPLYLVVSLVTGTFTIAAVSFVAGLLLTNIPLLAGLDPYGLSIAVLAVSGLVLLLGHYRALDDALAFLGCRVEQRMEGPDHWIIYAVVEQGNVADAEASTAVHHRKVGNHY